ncbi:MAG: DUF2752 domain-containing protein [Clostridia bacterium]|nr:DUF2752 domain-containing protein [Clostridia bacterium]
MIFVQYTHRGIPCLFYKITGWKCVGCGISRMLISLVRLDFISAFWHNPFLFITGPFILAYLVCRDAKYVLRGNGQMGRWEIFIWIELFLAIAYGIARNIFPI